MILTDWIYSATDNSPSVIVVLFALGGVGGGGVTCYHSMCPLWQSLCSFAGQWRTHIHHRWKHCSVRQRLLTCKRGKNKTLFSTTLIGFLCIYLICTKCIYRLKRDLMEESENSIQLMDDSLDCFQQAVFVSPQQLSHCAGGEQAVVVGPHVSGDQIWNDRMVLELLHHRLPGDRREKNLVQDFLLCEGLNRFLCFKNNLILIC